tara:strand:- start:397 stop:1131 length:735 start_codon:yes stop_codon:yes gene_type:complete
MKTLIMIPSRLSATRLPGKPLLKINGLSIISHVFKNAEKTNIGEVFVATEDKEILEDVNQNGGQAILTSNQPKSGTDRIFEAFKKLERSDIELVINLQGDEPMMNHEDIKNLHKQMLESGSKIGTLASEIASSSYLKKNEVVKVITKTKLEMSKFSQAIAFMREINNKIKNAYHHLGIYCYKVETLEKFCSLKQTKNEISHKLEQFRALDNNIDINVTLARSSPIGVDTQEDFVAIKKLMEYKL